VAAVRRRVCGIQARIRRPQPQCRRVLRPGRRSLYRDVPGAVDTGATTVMSGRRERGELSERSEVARARTFKAFF
jgi:hypothetical protein